MRTLCCRSHEHDTKQAARTCDVKMLGQCLAAMAWARDKLLREIKAVEEDGEDSMNTYSTMRAVANALDVHNNPRLK